MGQGLYIHFRVPRARRSAGRSALTQCCMQGIRAMRLLAIIRLEMTVAVSRLHALSQLHGVGKITSHMTGSPLQHPQFSSLALLTQNQTQSLNLEFHEPRAHWLAQSGTWAESDQDWKQCSVRRLSTCLKGSRN